MQHPIRIPETQIGDGDISMGSLFEDMQAVLKLPVIHTMIRDLAAYPDFLEMAWREVRANLITPQSRNFNQIRLTEIPPRIDWRGMYGPVTFQALRNTVDALYESNSKLLMLVTVWLEILSGRSISGQVGRPFRGTLSKNLSKTFNYGLIDIDETALSTRMMLEEIAAHIGSEEIPSDYLALAHYGDFLKINWSYLKPCLVSSEYRSCQEQLKLKSVYLLESLPYEISISPGTVNLAEHAELQKLLAYYQSQLTGLLLQMGYYQRSLEE